MSNFIMRYYFFLQEDREQADKLTDILQQHSLQPADIVQPAAFLVAEGFYFDLADLTGKMHILGIRTPTDMPDWINAWRTIQEWEKQAGLDVEDLMGMLTVLVDTDGNWNELLNAARPLLPCRKTESLYSGTSPLFRLSVTRKDNEAIYVYKADDPQTLAAPLLSRTLPILHGQMIYLQQLDSMLLDRSYSICREKDDLEKDLIKILHTKLVMNQPTLAINEELEGDIELLAIAFAKLVGDKKLISDGIQRMEPMVERIEKQFLSEPALGMDTGQIAQMMSSYHQRLGDMKQTYQDLALAEDNYQAAIEVVQSKIQVINSRTNIATQEQIRELLKINTEMQKKSLVYQYAAGLIEFIILAYYSLNLWSHLTITAAEAIPGWIQFVILMLFSGNTVLLTHYVAEYAQGEKHIRNKLIFASITLAAILLIVLIGSIWAMGKGIPASTH